MAHVDTCTLVSDQERARAADDPTLGAGNFVATALRLSPAPDAPILFLERPLRSVFGGTLTLSLRRLDELANLYAGWYQSLGVTAQDPVAVYLDDGVEYLIHYLALTRLGAIPALTNGNMATEIAALHINRLGVVAVFTDVAHAGIKAFLTNDTGLFLTESDVDVHATPLPAAAHFPHVDGDPVMIAHSSGTTGVPKPVLLEHDKYFYGVRYRLRMPRIGGGERILSSLPHSHNCAIAYQMLALLSGTPVYVASNHEGRAVLSMIESFRPTMVVSFPQTFVEMTEQDLDAYDLDSVNLWFNGGDAAHENHIRRLVAQGTRMENGVRVPGSIFVDGMGSSEMGFSLFRNIHTIHSDNYGRCVGKPLDWVEAAVLSPKGEILGLGIVGRLGVKAPSVTTGYWNDSLRTYKSRVRGYFLTGDLVFRDEQGRYFHVDRTPDAITTAKGPVYSLYTEELLMRHCPEIADCSIYGIAGEARAVVRWRGDWAPAERELLSRFNLILAEAGLNPLSDVRLVGSKNVPLGTTGKVLKRLLREGAHA